jgi:hypothetical protein
MKHVMAELHEIINELEDQGLIKEASSLIDVFNGMYKRAYNKDFGATRVVAPPYKLNPNFKPGDPIPDLDGATRVIAPSYKLKPNWNPNNNPNDNPDNNPDGPGVQEFAFGDSMEESDESSLPDMITEAVNKYGVADLILEIAKQIGK